MYLIDIFKYKCYSLGVVRSLETHVLALQCGDVERWSLEREVEPSWRWSLVGGGAQREVVPSGRWYLAGGGA